ncbi:MAG: hypothetical protein KDB71_15520 [Mycobacterium sp.]|nr:hypothetical protein [Mycobacterium sp.]
MIPQAILATAIALLPLAGGTPAPTHYPMPASGVVASLLPGGIPEDGDGVVQEDEEGWNCLTMGNRRCG